MLTAISCMPKSPWTLQRNELALRQHIPSITSAVQVYEFNVPTFGKGVVFDVDHKVGPCPALLTSPALTEQQS